MDLTDAGLREQCGCRGCTRGRGWDVNGARCVVSTLREVRDAAREEQREANASLIYDLAHKMAERGLFVRDDFGEPNIHAIQEIVAAIRSQR